MTPIFTVRGLVICFEAIMEDLEEAEEHLKALEMPETEIERMMSTHKCFTAAVSGWRHGKCVADESIGMCWHKEEEDFWQDENGRIRREGYFHDLSQEIVKQAEKMSVISEPRGPGYEPFSTLAEFVYLDDHDVMRWCPRSEESRQRCGYEKMQQYDQLMNYKFAHAAVAEGEFTFMGQIYNHMEVKNYLRNRQREYDENNQRTGGPAEQNAGN